MNVKIRIKLYVYWIVCIVVSLKWYYLIEWYVNVEWMVSIKWKFCECMMRVLLIVSVNGVECGEYKWMYGKYIVWLLWVYFEYMEKLKCRMFYGLLC